MKLSREQVERVQSEAEAYKLAAKNLGKAATELWQARIDMSIAVGEADSLDDMIGPGKVASWTGGDNCSCRTALPVDMQEVERKL